MLKRILPVLRFIILWAIGHGIILWLNEEGIYPDRWIARMLGDAMRPDTLTSISWILSGLFALILTIAWEAFQVSDKATKAIRQATQPSRLPFAQETKQETQRSLQHKERLPSNITLKDLGELHRGRTIAEAERITSSYINKYISVSGKVRDVITHYGNTVFLTENSLPENSAFSVNLSFGDEWKTRIELLRIGDPIKVEVKILRFSILNFYLDNCELIDV
jgi:hypothetical protein